MSMWHITEIKMAVLTMALILAMGMAACSNKTDTPVNQIVDKSVAILAGLMDCRNQFAASFQTINASKESVSAEGRLEQLMNALTARQNCEDNAFKK